MGHGARTVIAGLALLTAIGVVSVRVLRHSPLGGDPTVAPDEAMVDFRSAVYWPLVAYLAGENPYDKAGFLRRYPVPAGIGLYSPLTLVLHLPFGLLAVGPAVLAYYVLSVALTVLLAALALRLADVRAGPAAVLGFATLLVLGRPGHWNLFLGQVSLEAALATYAAVWLARTRPLAAGLGLAAATFKPSYGVPLGLLMLAWGDRRAIVAGIAVAAALSLAALVPIVATAGLDGFVGSVLATYQAREANPLRGPAVSPFRVDVVSLAGRLLDRSPGTPAALALTAGVLAVAAAGLRALGAHPGRAVRMHALGLVALAIVTCTYHQQYDLVVLAAPLALLLWRPHAPPWAGRPGVRRLTLVLMTLPFLNYAASGNGVVALGLERRTLLAVSSVNNVALLAALAVYAWLARRGVWPEEEP